jgi:hypothetical protein
LKVRRHEQPLDPLIHRDEVPHVGHEINAAHVNLQHRPVVPAAGAEVGHERVVARIERAHEAHEPLGQVVAAAALFVALPVADVAQQVFHWALKDHQQSRTHERAELLLQPLVDHLQRLGGEIRLVHVAVQHFAECVAVGER